MNNAYPVNVAILALPETSASVIYGMYDIFMSAGRDWELIVDGTPGASLFLPRVVSAKHESFKAANNVQILPDDTLDACAFAEVICVPELMVPPGTSLGGRFAKEVDCLRKAYSEGKTIAAACSGAMLLAEAGLLDGQEATTHWAYCDTLKRNYPKVKVHTRRALVAAGNGQRLIMAGGGTSWLDLALYLIARFAGIEVAMQTARINLIEWHEVGQQPFARLARSRQVDDAAIAKCQTWVAHNYMTSAPVNAMVKLSGLAERTFKRRFQLATGMPPLEYVHTLRLEEAKQMLEATDDSIEAIANAVGYEDAAYFSRLFKRQVNLSPVQYRKRFGSMRKALAQDNG